MNETSYIERVCLKKGIRLSIKGTRWAENAEGTAFVLFILLAFVVVGTIETGRWFLMTLLSRLGSNKPLRVSEGSFIRRRNPSSRAGKIPKSNLVR
jgi:hypothetical protein